MTIIKKYNEGTSQWEPILVGQKGDTGEGVPDGGSAGQVLAKASGTAYDTQWSWSPQLAWPSNTRFVMMAQTPLSFGGSSWAPARDRLYFTPIFTRSSFTLVGLHTRVIANAAAGATFRLGIYSATSLGQPGSLLLDAGTVDASSTGFKSISGLSLAMVPGLYFAAFVMQGAATGPTTYNWAGTPSFQFSTSVGSLQHDRRSHYAMAGQTGALPASFSGSNPESSLDMPHIVLERS